MRKCARGTFIDEVPEMEIEGGLVHIVSDGESYYMRPSVVRRYAETARRLIDKFDADQRRAIPLGGRSR